MGQPDSSNPSDETFNPEEELGTLVSEAQGKVLSANDVSGNLQSLYASASSNILGTDSGYATTPGLSTDVHTLYSDTGVKELGNTIADQTASIKAQIEENMILKGKPGD